MKQKKPVEDFYTNKQVVKGYIDRRFSGLGGSFVNKLELVSLLEYLPPSLRNKRIADLGSGTGRLTIRILEYNPKVLYAVDASREMLDSLKSYKKITPIKGLSKKIPLKNGELDFVISLRLFEHLDKKTLDKTLKEAKRVLKKGGGIIFNTVNDFSLESALVSALGSSSSDVYPISNQQIKKLLRKNGFTLRSKKNYLVLPRGIFMHAPSSVAKLFIAFEGLLIRTPLYMFANHIAWFAVSDS